MKSRGERAFGVPVHVVSAVTGRGAELFVWTVDDVRRLERLRTLAVTGVITNERDLFERA